MRYERDFLQRALAICLRDDVAPHPQGSGGQLANSRWEPAWCNTLQEKHTKITVFMKIASSYASPFQHGGQLKVTGEKLMVGHWQIRKKPGNHVFLGTKRSNLTSACQNHELFSKWRS